MNDQEYAEILLNHLIPVFYKVLSIPRKQSKGKGTYYFRLSELRQIFQQLDATLQKGQLKCFDASNLPVGDLRNKITDIKNALGNHQAHGMQLHKGGRLSQARYIALVASIKSCLKAYGYDFSDHEQRGKENLEMIVSTIKAKINISKLDTSPFATNDPIVLHTEVINFVNKALNMLEEEVVKYCSNTEVLTINHIRKVLGIFWNTVENRIPMSIEAFNEVHDSLNLILFSVKKEASMPKTGTITDPNQLPPSFTSVSVIDDVFNREVHETLTAIGNMLVEKNRKYGNSALSPSRVFSRSNSIEQLKVRIDDKLTRIRNQQTDEDEDVVSDLIGYLVLLKIAQKRNKIS